MAGPIKQAGQIRPSENYDDTRPVSGALSAASLEDNLNDVRSLLRIIIDPASPWNTTPSTNLQAAATALSSVVSDIIAGTGLLGGGAGPTVTLDVDAGVGPDQIVQLDGLGRLPAVDGSQLTGLSFPPSAVPVYDVFVPTLSQTVFTLSQSATGLYSSAFINGIRYQHGLHYTISGTTFTWLPIPAGFTLDPTDLLVVGYPGA